MALLTTRDLVKHGVRGMLSDLPVPVHFTDQIHATYPADVILVDATGTPDESAQELESVTDDERAPVILLTSRDAPPEFGTWHTPIHAFLTVSATDAEMVAAVASALRASAVSRASRAVATPRTRDGLSEREVQILTAIAAGMSNEEIARELFIGVNTVKTYIRTTYRKIGTKTRPKALLWALGHGLGADGVGRIVDEKDGTWSGEDPA